MLSFYKNGSSVLITSNDEYTFPFENGKITVPFNSLTFVLDDSDFICFKSIANNDIICQDELASVSFNGIQATRNNIVALFDEVCCKVYESGSGSLDTSLYEIVQTLPSTNIKENIIYLVYDSQSIEGNLFNEYLYVLGQWEKIGQMTSSGDLANYYTKNQVDNLLNGYATTSTTESLTTMVNAKVETSTYNTKVGELESSIAQKADASNTYTKSEVDSAITQSLNDYSTTSEVNSAITEALSPYQKKSDAFTKASADALYQPKGNYALSGDIPTKTSELANDSGFITSGDIPSNIVTEEELESKGYLTEHQHLKTINGTSLVGDGNITIEGGGTSYDDTELRNKINAISGDVATISGDIVTAQDGSDTKQFVYSNPSDYSKNVVASIGVEQGADSVSLRVVSWNNTETSLYDKTIGQASSTQSGVMSSNDKKNLDKLVSDSANYGNYTFSAGTNITLDINSSNNVLTISSSGGGETYDDTELRNKIDAVSGDVSTISGDVNSLSSNVYTKDEIDGKGYLTAYTETDPIWESEKGNYLKTSDAESTYQPKGNYLTAYTETDPIWESEKGDYLKSSDAESTYQPIGNYLTAYTETDPIWESEKDNYYDKTEVDSKIKYTVEDSLPSSGDEGDMVYVKKNASGIKTSASTIGSFYERILIPSSYDFNSNANFDGENGGNGSVTIYISDGDISAYVMAGSVSASFQTIGGVEYVKVEIINEKIKSESEDWLVWEVDNENGKVFVNDGDNWNQFGGNDGIKLLAISQDDYDALTTKDPNTLYIING